jgi:hypothetical protein
MLHGAINYISDYESFTGDRILCGAMYDKE